MTHYQYLILGGGMSAAAAVNGIREVDPDGSIGLISKEINPPYDRPPLSKGLWKGKPLEKIWREVAKPGVTLMLGRKALTLNPQLKRVLDERDEVHTYDRLLLATGGAPRRLPFGEDEILYFRTLEDYQKLQTEAEKKLHFGVIGGGFIGSELAAALRMNDARVTMLFPERGVGGLAFPADLTDFVSDYFRSKGVAVRSNTLVKGVERGENRVEIITGSGERIMVDRLVAGIGIRPNVELAEQAGLAVENGVIVDKYLRTSDNDIYAAGDVANFFNPTLSDRLRVEHEDNANRMGKLAGRNMASGEPEEYDYLPYFYSDLFELGYEAVGELNASLETVEDWIEQPYKKGVVYYLREGSVRGVLLWNVWDKLDAARQVIGVAGPFSAKELIGRIS